ncbi:DUF5753 domain-containing protein [Actinomadura sp. 9N407]|uniref:DUF5753 domain-containing protein n=1 Tax=Actinomadura sp. 9N407 TaxID=3375154 RepID=UPI0037B307A3
MQTEEYARAVITAVPLGDPQETVDRFVGLRMGRQRLLTCGNPPPIHAIIGVAALRQVMGGRAVMTDQLELLQELARLDHITLQVIPYDAGAHAALDGPFIILDVRPAHRIVLANHVLGAVYSDLAAEVRRCTLVFESLQKSALSKAASLALIEQVIEDLQRKP